MAGNWNQFWEQQSYGVLAVTHFHPCLKFKARQRAEFYQGDHPGEHKAMFANDRIGGKLGKLHKPTYLKH